jgi:hypothetical protein
MNKVIIACLLVIVAFVAYAAYHPEGHLMAGGGDSGKNYDDRTHLMGADSGKNAKDDCGLKDVVGWTYKDGPGLQFRTVNGGGMQLGDVVEIGNKPKGAEISLLITDPNKPKPKDEIGLEEVWINKPRPDADVHLGIHVGGGGGLYLEENPFGRVKEHAWQDSI